MHFSEGKGERVDAGGECWGRDWKEKREGVETVIGLGKIN